MKGKMTKTKQLQIPMFVYLSTKFLCVNINAHT